MFDKIKINSHKYIILHTCLILVLTILACLPVLLNSYFCILDCPYFYHLADNVNLFNPKTYLFLEHTANRARPGLFLMFSPAYFATSATFHYLFQNIFLLFSSVLIISWLIYRITGKKYLAIIGIIPILCNATFSENYYTLFKGEPYMLAGAIYVVFVLWNILFVNCKENKLWKNLFLIIMGIVGAILIFTIKETGGAFIGVYIIGIFLLGWGAGLSWKVTIKKTWWLTLVCFLSFAILVTFFMRLKSTYTAGGDVAYSLQLPDIMSGIVRMLSYYFTTASYIFSSIIIILIAFLILLFNNSIKKDSLKLKIAWNAFFLLFCAGMSAALIPWTNLDPRHYLVGMIGAIVTGILSIDLAFYISKQKINKLITFSLWGLVSVTIILLVFHTFYSLTVGQFSEGRVRQLFDSAYNDMFQYIADKTPTNGTAYFMMDKKMPEPIKNSRLTMDLFYNRPDINCVFPNSINEFYGSGLVAVTEYNVQMNYERMPIHHEMEMLFNQKIKNKLGFIHKYKTIYETPIWYAEKKYHGPQYKSVFGIPAFWDLKKGNYKFGWNIFQFDGKNNERIKKLVKIDDKNLIKNSNFSDKLNNWEYWGAGTKSNNLIQIKRGVSGNYIQINNPDKKLIGVKQNINVTSGTVYRLSGKARSVLTTDSKILFGGRIAFFIPGEKEKQIVWMSEYNNWWNKEIIFTNQISGVATVYIHMGYGNVASVGEFTDVKLEKLY